MTLGVLAVQTYDENVRFDEKDRDVLARVGQHVAAALERVRLHEETRQHLRELKAVNRIGQALAAQLDLDGLIALVGAPDRGDLLGRHHLRRILEAETGTISFPFYSESGVPAERPGVPLGDGPTSRVLRSQEPLLLHGSAEFGEVGERLVGSAEGSYLGVPIVTGGRAIGVLSVQTTGSDSRYGEPDARLLATVAAGVAIGIQNARLLESQRSSERRYRELVESIPIAVYRSSVDARNASEYMSERAVAIFGYPIEAWYDDDFFEQVLHPDDRDWVLAENELEPTEDDSVWVSEYRVIAADGRTVWVRDESWTVTGRGGHAPVRPGLHDRRHRAEAGPARAGRRLGRAPPGRAAVPPPDRGAADGGLHRQAGHDVHVDLHQPSGRGDVRLPAGGLDGGDVLRLGRAPRRLRAGLRDRRRSTWADRMRASARSTG